MDWLEFSSKIVAEERHLNRKFIKPSLMVEEGTTRNVAVTPVSFI